jgi:radical SAM family uncharacterized protein
MVLTPSEIQAKLERILLKVEKPGRYVGGEFNQVVKNWDEMETHVALIFPEIYDIGLSNLGVTVLYNILNERNDVAAERGYVPWIDMEAEMRKMDIPLYSLETKHALADFDILAFSLPYETLYTNMLNALDLAKVPLYSKDRSQNQPLVIAGGHAVFNPEPVAPFIDAFVIGEGEEAINDVVNAYQAWKRSGSDRENLLFSLTKIPGVYVPAFYEPQYKPDGTMSGMHRMNAAVPEKITKRIVGKLPPSPTKLIIPTISIVHNRVVVEIMRGCTRGCRFCHAGMVNRPVRERSVEEILKTIEESLENTGYEEVALLSLSSSDYREIGKLVETIKERFEDQNLTISLPSLRIESFSIDLMEKLKGSRQGGFTLAPEAGTDKMRNTINKPITPQQLLDTAHEIYKRGWPTIKLYFMIGQPNETLEDVQGIADLSRAVWKEGLRAIGKRSKVHTSVGTFVPKPHTPFQWAAVDLPEVIAEKQEILKRDLGGPGMKLNWADPKETLLESWLARGDRRMADVIYHAWKNGTKFDAWHDVSCYEAWEKAFEECGLSYEFYTHRKRAMDEVFPWDHINIGVRKSFLAQDYQWSKDGKLRPDCRDQCYACGILPTFNEIRTENPGDVWQCPEPKVIPAIEKEMN